MAAINLWHMHSKLECGYKLLVNPFSGGVAPTEQCKPLDHWQTWVYIAANRLEMRDASTLGVFAMTEFMITLFRLCPDKI